MSDDRDHRRDEEQDRQDINVYVNTNEERRPVDEPTPEERASFATAQLLWIIAVLLVIVLIVVLFFSGIIDIGGGGDNGVLDATTGP